MVNLIKYAMLNHFRPCGGRVVGAHALQQEDYWVDCLNAILVVSNGDTSYLAS